ncbi:MAG TPA: hypothetical protein VFM56_04985 [Solimonas sp.]|nr:hypothetical protein [Solimonas sp.]
MSADRNPLVEEAARIVCSEALTDYRAAKLKAVQRLGLSPHATALPDNAQIDAAVVSYLQLFGGPAYQQRLQRLRRLAVQLMRRLAPFEPRLTGGAVSGAVTMAHRLQLHVFAEQSEAVDVFLIEQGLPFELSERRYRYPDGREETMPLMQLEIDGLGVDIAVFALDDLRRTPLSPQDGRPYRRLNLAAAEALAAD